MRRALLFLLLFGCGPTTTDLAYQIPRYVSPVASTAACPGGTVSAAGWCCISMPVPVCSPTPTAFVDGLELPLDVQAAPQVQP